MSLESPVPSTEAVPFDAVPEMLQVKSLAGMSASEACSVRLNGVGLPFVDMVTPTESPSVMTGAELTSLTVTVIVSQTVAVSSVTQTSKV